MVFNVHLIAMAGGNTTREASNNLDWEVNNDEGTNASFADAGINPNSSNPIHDTSVLFYRSQFAYICANCLMWETRVNHVPNF